MYGTLGVGFGVMMALFFGFAGVGGAIGFAVDGLYVQAVVVPLACIPIAVFFGREELRHTRTLSYAVTKIHIEQLEKELFEEVKSDGNHA